MHRLSSLFFMSVLSVVANAQVISHTENFKIDILHAEHTLTCATNDFDSSKGYAELASSEVFYGAILNGQQYSIVDPKEGADVLCRKIRSMIQDADEIHPGTGKHLSGLVSSTLALDGNKLSEHVTVNVFLPKDPSRNLTFESSSERFLNPPQ